MRTPHSLHPLSIGDLLDAAFRLYRAHFATFAGVAALLLVPMAIVQILAQALLAAAALAQSFQNLLVVTVVSGALTNAAAQAYLGQSPSIAGAYRLPASRYVALIVAPIALGLAAALPLLLIFGCMFGLALGSSLGGVDTGWAMLLVLLALALLVPLLLLTVRCLLVDQAIVLEGYGAIDGLKRSWHLCGRAFWRVAGVALLLGLLTFLISGVPALLAGAVLQVVGTSLDPLGSQSITIGLSQLGLIVALPLQVAVYTLLYYDLRVRAEGYDLELLAQQAAL